MCHTWTLWSVDVHNITCVRPDQRVSQSWTLFKFLQIHNRERLCLKPLPQFSSHPDETCYMYLIHMKSQCLLHTVCEAWHRGTKVCPFFKTLICAYRESVKIFFHSFQVINMIFFIFCDIEGLGGIFITMNDSSPFFWDIQTNFSKQLFANYNKLLSCLEIDYGSSKTA